jgi:hypothetical protein
MVKMDCLDQRERRRHTKVLTIDPALKLALGDRVLIVGQRQGVMDAGRRWASAWACCSARSSCTSAVPT